MCIALSTSRTSLSSSLPSSTFPRRPSDWQGAVDCQGDTDTILGYYQAQQQVFLDAGTVTEEVPVENYVKTDIMDEANTIFEEIK